MNKRSDIMTNKEYADLLLPCVKHTWEEYEAMYPEDESIYANHVN